MGAGEIIYEKEFFAVAQHKKAFRIPERWRHHRKIAHVATCCAAVNRRCGDLNESEQSRSVPFRRGSARCAEARFRPFESIAPAVERASAKLSERWRAASASFRCECLRLDREARRCQRDRDLLARQKRIGIFGNRCHHMPFGMFRWLQWCAGNRAK